MLNKTKIRCHVCDFINSTNSEEDYLSVCKKCGVNLENPDETKQMEDLCGYLKNPQRKLQQVGMLYLTNIHLICVRSKSEIFPFPAFHSGLSSEVNLPPIKPIRILFQDIKSVEIVDYGLLVGNGLRICTMDSIEHNIQLGTKRPCIKWKDAILKLVSETK